MFKKNILIFFAIIFFIASFLIFKHHFSIFYFQNDINKIAINIEGKYSGEVNICFDKLCDKMDHQNGVYSYELNQQNPLFYNHSPEYIEIITEKKSAKDNFNSISIFYNLNDIFYANKEGIEKLDSFEIEFQGKKSYTQEIFFNHANNKTLIQKMAIYFEGIFYNWYFYIISYVLILLYLVKNQTKIDIKRKCGIFIILFLALILRLSHINYIPLWNDELYTCCFISDLGQNLNLKRTFLDPGNPPLFFVLSNIWLMFFNKTTTLIRLLPCLIGVLNIYFIYFILEKLLNRKIALSAAFLSAINIILILESNEIRSYILSMGLILWGMYYFFKLKESFTARSLIYYSIITIFLINTHYYCLFYALANFLAGAILFKKDRLKFIFANILCALTFLPYLFKTVLNFSLNKGFNTWIEKPSIAMLNNHIVFYFGNILWFILIIAFTIFIYKKLQKKEKEILLYTTGTISFVFVLAFLISILIKPVLFERYFIIFLPYLIINTAIFLNANYKTKFAPIVICAIFLFSINAPKYENFNLFSNISLMAKYSYLDSEANKKDYRSYYIIPDVCEYIKFFPYIDKNKVIISKYGMLNDEMLVEKILNDIEDKKSKKILYFPEQTFNFLLRNSKKLNVKKIETTIMRVYKVYID